MVSYFVTGGSYGSMYSGLSLSSSYVLAGAGGRGLFCDSSTGQVPLFELITGSK